MSMQVGYYALCLFAGAVIAGAVAAIAGKRAVTSVGRILAALMASVFVWSLAAALEAAVHGTAVKVLFSKIEYLGVATVPLLMFLFSLRFLRAGGRLKKGLTAVLWVIPAATIILAFTNEWHHLIWTGFTPAANPRDHLLIYDHGPFFWVHAGYSYLLLVATTVFLLLAYFRFKGVYRRQALALLLAFPVPWIVNALYLAGLASSDSGYDFTPVGFAISGFFLLWAMFRLGLVDLVPMARERVIESMGESLLILDESGRLAATNPAARRLIAEAGGPAESAPEARLLGRPAAELFPSWPDLAAPLGAPAATEREFPLVKDGPPRYFDLHLTPLLGHGTVITGWVAVLYDITRIKNAEKAAIEARNVAETLREAGLTLSSKLDFRQISDVILDLLKRVIPYDVGAFLTVEGAELRLAAIKQPLEVIRLLGDTFPLAGSRLCHMTVQRGRPLISPVGGPEDILLPLLPNWDVHSFLGVPIVFRDRVTGLIALYNSGTQGFSEGDARVAELFAGQVAIALDNSRRVEIMEKQAVTDELTGLYNRRAFADVGEKEVGRARRYRRPLSLILFDIDHFKNVNDTYGHPVGDHVLRLLTKLVTRTTRSTDHVCRYGGEEFIVLMPEAGHDEGLAMADRLRLEISRMTIVAAGTGEIALTVSCGVAELRPDDPGEDLDGLIARADRAMYQAKAAGRNTVRG
jgi:diguanylate cyclase (GGDEF)-like protein